MCKTLMNLKEFSFSFLSTFSIKTTFLYIWNIFKSYSQSQVFYRLFRSDNIRRGKICIRCGGGTKRKDTSSDAIKDFNAGNPSLPWLCQELLWLLLAQGWLRPLPSCGGVSESVFMNPVHCLLHPHADPPAAAQLRAHVILPLESSGSPDEARPEGPVFLAVAV